MSHEKNDRRYALVQREPQIPVEPGWANEAVTVTGPLAAFGFRIRARANMKAMQTAMQHARVYGQLVEVGAETIGKIQKVQDAVREYQARQELEGELFEGEIERQRERLEEERHRRELARSQRQGDPVKAETIGKIQKVQDAERTYQARQELADELFEGEIERQREQLEEERHRRELARSQRQAELVKAETLTLEAQQAHRAKKKFEKLKHAAGKARFTSKVAERQGGAAAAQAAAAENELNRRVAEEAAQELNGKKATNVTGSVGVEDGFREELFTRLIGLPELIKQASADGDEWRVSELEEELRVLKRIFVSGATKGVG
jgi:hypothetical protein